MRGDGSLHPKHRISKNIGSWGRRARVQLLPVDRDRLSTGTHITCASSRILQTLCLGPTAVLSTRLRILQNSEKQLNVGETRGIKYDLPSILPVVSEKGTISASSITSLMTQDIPVLVLKGTTEPGRPKASKITLGMISVNGAFLIHGTNSLMDGLSIVCRFPLTLTKNLELYRSTLLVNLDVDLSAFTVVFGLGPDQLRIREKFQRLSTPCAFDGLWNLGRPDYHVFIQCSYSQ